MNQTVYVPFFYFDTVFEIQDVYCSYSTFQFGLATFKKLHSLMSFEEHKANCQNKKRNGHKQVDKAVFVL